MAIGHLRLNERHQRPNQKVNFIKALDTPDHDIALDILERVAAIVHPIMKDNGLGIGSLDEFPPNREFWGRNFNGGECVQLVLKSPTTGLWLPFQFIVKVMLHEMAHIKEMNHSSAFHKVRIGYETEMMALNARGYTGDGFWSSGNTVSGQATAPRMLANEELPAHLCGGMYRTAKKVRRKVSYAEQKQRRKERKFGKSEGDAVGMDEKERRALEKKTGKSSKAVAVKPRVAQSGRGRDLRLEAALRRLEASQASTSAKKEEEEEDEDSDEDELIEVEEDGAIDIGHDKRMVKMEDHGEPDALDDEWEEMLCEMRNLRDTADRVRSSAAATSAGPTDCSVGTSSSIKGKQKATNGGDLFSSSGTSKGTNGNGSLDGFLKRSNGSSSKATSSVRPPAPDSDEETVKSEDEDQDTPPPPTRVQRARPKMPSPKPEEDEDDGQDTPPPPPPPQPRRLDPLPRECEHVDLTEDDDDYDELPPPLRSQVAASDAARNASSQIARSDAVRGASSQKMNGNRSCPVCTVVNSEGSVMCEVCACVLDTSRTPSWICTSNACKEVRFANPMDAGICTNCGTRRP